MTEVIHRVTHLDFDEELEDEEREEEVQLETGFANVVVVDNLPIVPKEKFGKLFDVTQKIFKQFGPIVDDGLYLPLDENEMTKGYVPYSFSIVVRLNDHTFAFLF